VIGTDPGRELQLRLELPDDADELREVSVPFTIDGVPSEASTAPVSFVTIASGDQDYYFTAPPGASIDLANRKIVLQPEAAEQAVRYALATEGDPARVVAWFDDESLRIEAAAYDAAIAAWVDGAYRGWSGGRYSSARLSWEMPGGFSTFSEEALTAYLAEAWTRNEYDRAFAEMRRARDLYPDELTLLSAPFLGNLDEIRERFLESDRVRAELIREQLAAEDPTIYRQEDLFRFAADRTDEATYTALVQFTENVDLRSLDIASAIGLLRNLFLDPLPDERAEALSLRAIDLIQMKLLGTIARTGEGFFVQTSPGQIDLYQTAVAGAVLESFGESRGDRTMTTIGRNLVVSVLGRADANSVVPSTLLVRGETVEAADGEVAPERLYPLLAQAPNYPRARSLYRELGSGHWIWSVVDVTPVRLSQTEWRFELAYPRLRTHYLVFQGVPEY